jgi:hypothetical protein
VSRTACASRSTPRDQSRTRSLAIATTCISSVPA